MACPFFVPHEVLNDGSWPHPSRLPLGAGWSGACCASDAATVPSDFQIREYCNLGYAKGCPHLPPERDWDAVRFAVAWVSEEQVVLSYVCERGHAPIEHGKLTFDRPADGWVAAHSDARVQRLADCFLRTYRTRQAGAVLAWQRNP